MIHKWEAMILAGRRRMSQATEKPKDTWYVLKRLGQYLMKYKCLLLIALILSIGSNFLALLGPMLAGHAINAIEPGKGKVVFNEVFYYGKLMALFYIGSSILSYFLSIIMINISRKIVSVMRKDVFCKLQVLPVSYFDSHQLGDILSRISYDIDVINTSLSNDLIQILASLITVVGSLVMMIVISPTLALISVITIPLSVVYTKYMTGKIRPLFKLRSEALGNLNGFTEETISGQKTIKSYSREEKIIDKFDVINENAVNSYYNADYIGSMMGPSVAFINNLSLSLVTVFGAVLYLYQKISLGNISSFILYSRKFSGPINEAANIVSELQSTLAAAERVLVLLDENEEKEDSSNAVELSDVEGNVELQNVSFGYTKDRIILHDLSIKAEQGKMIAIVGPTGAGKTTIINLLMRFYDADRGVISIDGKEICSVKRKSLRKAYAMVLQDTWLFGGTIYENIAYGKEEVSMEEVIEAAKAARIHNYISHLKDGYNTVINDDGTNLSKGQKQLITIARAMLLDAKILILDEATSNVDTRTEVHIREAMRKLMNDKTCFVIAHRLSTIVDSDLILVVNDGDVIEQGTHQELMDKKGYYYSLYNSK